MTTYEELREVALKAEKAAAYWKASAEKYENHLRHMLGVIKGGGIDSEQIDGDYEAGIPPHKWHEEWAAYVERDLKEQGQ